MLFPPNIIYIRIKQSIKIFFSDLQLYCNTMKLRYEVFQDISKDDELQLHVKNDMIEIEQVEWYDNKRPKAYIMTFNIPSPIDHAKKRNTPNLTDNIPVIGNTHKIYVRIPNNYPAVKSVEGGMHDTSSYYVESRTPIYHPRFYLHEKSWGCIMFNGEMDRVPMNLFQQLLWEPSHVWKVDKQRETSNNSDASRWGNNNGRIKVHEYLLNKLIEKYGMD